ncbi:transmembrane protein 42 [Rhodnius prolixus]|uniref:EamA domain-containing protein n=3 Tax=Rhodnius TaxID=13248 RepID=T1ICN3_RHOPR
MELLKVSKYVTYSIFGGSFGSLGSFLGKLSGSYSDSWLYYLIFFIAMIASNTIGSVLFAKSLSVSPTSLQPTVISTASNFISTAVFGVLFYEETTSLAWWTGTSLILTGIVLMSHEKKNKIQ